MPETLTGGFMMAAAHSDSPTFKLKEHAELRSNGYVRLNTEKYGGMLMATWFDRPLSVAGRLFIREGGGIAEKLVDIDRDLLVIPSVAIHMNRNANDGMKYQANVDTVPLFSAEDPDAAILSTASTSSPPSWTTWPAPGAAPRASWPPATAAACRYCASSTTRR